MSHHHNWSLNSLHKAHHNSSFLGTREIKCGWEIPAIYRMRRLWDWRHDLPRSRDQSQESSSFCRRSFDFVSWWLVNWSKTSIIILKLSARNTSSDRYCRINPQATILNLSSIGYKSFCYCDMVMVTLNKHFHRLGCIIFFREGFTMRYDMGHSHPTINRN